MNELNESVTESVSTHASTRLFKDDDILLVFATLVLAALASAWSIYFLNLSPAPLYAVVAVAVGALGWYTYTRREKLGEMCCMMIGMFFGGVPAMAIGAIYALSSGDYVASMIAGTIVGYVAGIAFGRYGGPLGRMEGAMAAPMGGFMGGMMGFMAIPFDTKLFAAFFMLIILALFAEMAWMVHRLYRKHECCE